MGYCSQNRYVNCRSIPISLTKRFGEVCTIGYCPQGRCVKSSIDTYLFDQYVQRNRYNGLLFLDQVCELSIDTYFLDQCAQRYNDRYLFSRAISSKKLVQQPIVLRYVCDFVHRYNFFGQHVRQMRAAVCCCSQDRHVRLSIGTYLFEQVPRNRYNRLDTYLFDQYREKYVLKAIVLKIGTRYGTLSTDIYFFNQCFNNRVQGICCFKQCI